MTTKPVYRIIKKFGEDYYHLQEYCPAWKLFFIITISESWKDMTYKDGSTMVFRNEKEAKERVEYLRKKDTIEVVWQSNTTDLVEQALLDKNDN